MRPHWPTHTAFTQIVLTVEDTACAGCGQALHVCDHRIHRIYTLHGPWELVCKLAHCPDRTCTAHGRTLSPAAEMTMTLPWWLLGWDVFCWMGQRRFARHWSVPQIRTELADSYQIPLSADAIEDSLRRYQVMVAARQQDAQLLAQAYRKHKSVVLSIDGLQPEKGHETLYVVRELNGKRVWFAEALLSSNADEVRRLLAQARRWAEQLGLPVRRWLSDKQDAFVTGIAAEFPGVPHQYCANHFLRDVAKPMLEADSHAKVQMRRHVRGLRTIEREIIQQQREPSEPSEPSEPAPSVAMPAPSPVPAAVEAAEPASAVVLDYCSAVRGILNDDQGGPLQPPGLRMAEALAEVQASLQRNLAADKPGVAHGQLERLAACIERGLSEVETEQASIRQQAQEVQRIGATLDQATGSRHARAEQFAQLHEEFAGQETPFYQHLAKVMASFAPGLFVGGARGRAPLDNLDLERWFRLPKGHERRIHGHRHAGARIVQEGPTLVLTLDAHQAHPQPFTAEDLGPYQHASAPECQRQALQRRTVMRKARSKKNDRPCSSN